MKNILNRGIGTVWIIIIIVLAVLLIVTNVEVKESVVKKPRIENHIKDCEIWKICDYKEKLWDYPRKQ